MVLQEIAEEKIGYETKAERQAFREEKEKRELKGGQK